MHEGTAKHGDVVEHLQLRLITKQVMHDVALQEVVLLFLQHVEALQAKVEVPLLEKAPCSTREPGLRRPTPPALASSPA